MKTLIKITLLILFASPAIADEVIAMKQVSMEVVPDCNYPSIRTPMVDPVTGVVGFIVKKSEKCK